MKSKADIGGPCSMPNRELAPLPAAEYCCISSMAWRLAVSVIWLRCAARVYMSFSSASACL